MACMMRTSARPSCPDGSGSRSWRMHSEKWTSSGANWSPGPKVSVRTVPLVVTSPGALWRSRRRGPGARPPACRPRETPRHRPRPGWRRTARCGCRESGGWRWWLRRLRAIDRRWRRPGRRDLHRLATEDVASGVDTVDTQVEEGPAAELAACPDVPLADLMTEDRAEETRLADPALAHALDGAEVGGLEMESVGHHELDVMLAGDGDHGRAVLLGGRQGFFAEDVHAGSRRALAHRAVPAVRDGDIDRVDLGVGEDPFELVVGARGRDPVFLGQLGELVGIGRHQGGELRVLLRVLEGRQDGNLSNVPEPHHRVPDPDVSRAWPWNAPPAVTWFEPRPRPRRGRRCPSRREMHRDLTERRRDLEGHGKPYADAGQAAFSFGLGGAHVASMFPRAAARMRSRPDWRTKTMAQNNTRNNGRGFAGINPN